MSIEVHLDVKIFQEGLEVIHENGERPTLCMLAPDRMRLVVQHDSGVLLSWEHQAALQGEMVQTFVAPSQVVKMLTGGVLDKVDEMSVRTGGQEVRLQLQGAEGATKLMWQWDPAAFPMFAASDMIFTAYPNAVEIDVEAFATTVLESMAQPEKMDVVQQEQHAFIAIAQIAPSISIGGRYLGRQSVAYYDLQALAHAVELVGWGADRVLMGIKQYDGTPHMSMRTEHAGGTLQCIIKADPHIAPDAAKRTAAPAIYATKDEPESLQAPLPPPPFEQPKETRPLETSLIRPVGRKRPLDEMRQELLSAIDEEDALDSDETT
jgi:hypothetical protein